MMRWIIQLPYKEKLEVSEQVKNKVEAQLKEGGMVQVGDRMIDTGQVKGFYPLEAESKQEKRELGFSNRIREINTEFNNDCRLWAEKTPKEKAKREMRVRILAGWKLMGGKREDSKMMDCYKTVLKFFEENPKYPRCPMENWWDIIAKKMNKKGMVTRFWEYVKRNDYVIEDWVRRN